MGLTPIRIRRKRKSHASRIPEAASNYEPKRMKRSLAAVRAGRSFRQRPALDYLPGEILESILLYSSNLALPRSSHVIGAKLSGKATLLRLFMMAFHETWLQWFGIPRHQVSDSGIKREDAQDEPCAGDPSFQSAMLDLPWANVDFILQAQQTWADRNARDRWYQHSVPFAEGEDTLNHEHEGGVAHFNARSCFEADYERALKWPAMSAEILRCGGQDVHPQVRAPTKLISGPWDEEDKRKLFWLIRGGIKIGGQGQPAVPWEVKLQCLDNAIISAEEPDPLILNCVIGNWIYKDLPEDIVRKQLISLDRRIEWGGDSQESRRIMRLTRAALDMFMQLPSYHNMPV